MPGRKRINPKTVFYELDASANRRVLGEPGDPKKHLPKMLARIKAKNVDILAETIDSVRISFPVEFEQEKDSLNLQNDEFISALFKAATTFDKQDRARDRAVASAFSAANLNPRNPLDWRVLMEIFCWAHFGEKGKPGRNIAWTGEQYSELLRDIHRYKTQGFTTDAAAIRQLRAETAVAKKYKSISSDRLKKALREARSPDYNDALRKAAFDATSMELDRRLKGENPAYREKDSKKLVKKIAREIADSIGARGP